MENHRVSFDGAIMSGSLSTAALHVDSKMSGRHILKMLQAREQCPAEFWAGILRKRRHRAKQSHISRAAGTSVQSRLHWDRETRDRVAIFASRKNNSGGTT
jgi:hypothetical protein